MEEGRRWDALLTLYERHLGAKEGRGAWEGELGAGAGCDKLKTADLKVGTHQFCEIR